jgi:cytoskeletal protein RodZ
MEVSASGLGERLRAARERRGLTVSDVADITKIPSHTVRAIEREEFGHLPGGIYRRGYVRAFAAAVGLDSAECCREYVARFEVPPDPAPPREVRTTRPRVDLLDQAPDGAVVVVAGAGLVLALTFALASMVRDRPAGEAALQVLDARPTMQPELVATGSPADAGQGGVAPPALRLRLAASADCWISAEADGRRVLYRVLAADEAIVIDAAASITLRIGNAGAITYSINELPSRRLGEPGQVVSLSFTPENYDAAPIADRLSIS